MLQLSRKIITNQQSLHPDLESVVRRHMESSFKKPISAFNRQAFAIADNYYQKHSDNFILDSGCGVGESTFHIAKNNPKAFVIGVDQSEPRLRRNNDWSLPENALLIHADLIDLWRLAVQSGWQLTQHFLLYPNPWPKKKHLQRRWHGHPVFPTLKDLGGLIELRTNWKTYAEEFSTAITILSGQHCQCQPWQAEEPITPFERKYQSSGQVLYRLTVPMQTQPFFSPVL